MFYSSLKLERSFSNYRKPNVNELLFLGLITDHVVTTASYLTDCRLEHATEYRELFKVSSFASEIFNV